MGLGNADGQIDYARYTLEQLKQVSTRIDRERAPLNYANLVNQIKLREAAVPVQGVAAYTPVWTYAGFFVRGCARALDGGLILSVMAVVMAFSHPAPLSFMWWQMPAWLGVLFLEVFLVARYGGTPGKLILGLRVVMVDGSSMTPRASFLRMLPHFVTFAVTLLAYAQIMLIMPKLNVLENAATLEALFPTWFRVANPLIGIWSVADCASVFLNSRRRALHDFIAGTMVVERTVASDIDPSRVVKVLQEDHEASRT